MEWIFGSGPRAVAGHVVQGLCSKSKCFDQSKSIVRSVQGRRWPLKLGDLKFLFLWLSLRSCVFGFTHVSRIERVLLLTQVINVFVTEACNNIVATCAEALSSKDIRLDCSVSNAYLNVSNIALLSRSDAK